MKNDVMPTPLLRQFRSDLCRAKALPANVQQVSGPKCRRIRSIR